MHPLQTPSQFFKFLVPSTQAADFQHEKIDDRLSTTMQVFVRDFVWASNFVDGRKENSEVLHFGVLQTSKVRERVRLLLSVQWVLRFVCQCTIWTQSPAQSSSSPAVPVRKRTKTKCGERPFQHVETAKQPEIHAELRTNLQT